MSKGILGTTNEATDDGPDRINRRSVVGEFLSSYRATGITYAVKWMARVTIVKVFQTLASIACVVFSPWIVDREELPERSSEVYWYGDSEEVSITMPDGIDDPVDLFAERTGEFTISKPYVSVVRDATVLGRYPVALDDWKVILQAAVSPSVLLLNVCYSMKHWVMEGFPLTRNPRRVDRAVLLYNKFNAGYYHWTTENLTRLEGVQHYAETTGERPKLIVGPELTRFQRETLEHLGYEEDDLIRWDGGRVTVDELIVPSVRREITPGEASPVAYSWLREQMRDAVPEAETGTDEEFSPYVYVSRDDAPRRQIINEDQLTSVLSEYGFERYVLSDHSVEENVRLFSQAEVVVGPHGAGLTDMIYSTDASVVELFRYNDVRPAYFVLARQLGHEYRYQLCDYRGPNLVLNRTQLDELEETVAELVE